ncbi:MAG: hypothetical protein R3C49_12170 [Planctomycetaceae bacterium]
MTKIEIFTNARNRLSVAFSGSGRRKSALIVMLLVLGAAISDPEFLQDPQVRVDLQPDGSIGTTDEFEELEELLALENAAQQPPSEPAATAEEFIPGVTLTETPTAVDSPPPRIQSSQPVLTLTIPDNSTPAGPASNSIQSHGTTLRSVSFPSEIPSPPTPAKQPPRANITSDNSHRNPTVRLTGSIVPL